DHVDRRLPHVLQLVVGDDRVGSDQLDARRGETQVVVRLDESGRLRTSGVEPVHGLRLVAPDTLEERYVVGGAQWSANEADNLAAGSLEALDERVFGVEARRVIADD